MVIFGYDKLQDNGEPITNGFEFKDGISPINLGFAGYDTDLNTLDKDLNSTIKHPILHKTHFENIKHFHNIEVKQVDEIKDRYY